MSQPTAEFKRSITFPAGYTCPRDVQEGILHLATNYGGELTDEIISKYPELFADLSIEGKRFHIALVLEELLKNMVIHDLMNIHGAERGRFLESRELAVDEQAQFRARLTDACGRCNSLLVVLTKERLQFEVRLARPFPSFLELWRKAQEEDPSAEQLELPYGRGIKIIASFCEAATYCDEQLAINFFLCLKVE